GAGDVATWPRTSPLVIRPPRPVPVTWLASTCSSATTRRAAGESAPPPLLPGEADAGAAAFAGAAAGRTGAAGAGRGSGSIVPIVAPIATVEPSAAAVFRTPEDAAGTTLLALSVSSSNSGSPAFTAAPSDFSQRARMPSVIDSPTPGTVMGTAAMISSL